MEKRHGLVVQTRATHVTGTAERATAPALLLAHGVGRGCSVGDDRAYDTPGVVTAVRALGATPHVGQNANRVSGSTIDFRATLYESYALSQACRSPRGTRLRLGRTDCGVAQDQAARPGTYPRALPVRLERCVQPEASHPAGRRGEQDRGDGRRARRPTPRVARRRTTIGHHPRTAGHITVVQASSSAKPLGPDERITLGKRVSKLQCIRLCCVLVRV